MHIKCLRRGTGSAGKAADYVVGERDAMGREREGVEVLRGDPDMVAAVADSLEFEHKYRSIVIAWAPEDRPTDGQINAVLDEFEKTAWAGLEPDRYSWTAVLHREHGGGVHVHILTARCDLETGKSLNIAPPGWQKTFDPLRDAFNHEHGWSRPDDPARARTQQPGHRAYIEAAKLRAGLVHEADPRELIRDYVVQRIEHGVVQSRADVVATLEDAGFDLLAWLGSTREHPLIASSVFHYEFEFIHPFEDGNGRMGRLWQTLILTRWKPLFAQVPVESLVRARQGDYYQAIRHSSAEGESTAFIAFMLDAILAAVRTPQEAPHVTPQVRRLLSVLVGEMSRQDILHALGLSDRKSFRQRYLSPALQGGYVEMTRPDAPNARNQRYRLTRLGRQIQPEVPEG